MDPILFGVDSQVVLEVLGTLVLMSILIERFLAVILEWRLVIEKIDKKGVKEPIAFGVSFIVAYWYHFDALAIIFSEQANSILGYILTAGIVAGGSKGSMKLFKDFLGWKSGAAKALEEAKK